MLLDLGNLEAVVGVVDQHHLHQVTGVADQVLGQVQLAAPALLHDGLGVTGFVLSLERREASHDLANEYSQAPDICFVRVAGVEHHFWSTVARSAAVRISSVLPDVLHDFREPEVDELYVTNAVNQDVVRFEVSVNDAHCVQRLNGHHDLSNVEARVFFTHEHLLPDLFEQLASRQVVQHHVQVQLILQRLLNVAAEVVLLELSDYFLLVFDVLDLLLASDILFFQAFECIVLVCLHVLDQIHFSETALAKLPDRGEVIKVELLLGLLRLEGYLHFCR